LKIIEVSCTDEASEFKTNTTITVQRALTGFSLDAAPSVVPVPNGNVNFFLNLGSKLHIFYLHYTILLNDIIIFIFLIHLQ